MLCSCLSFSFSVWVCALLQNSLQLPFIFFFFFSSSAGFWTEWLKLFNKRFIINYQGSVWLRSDSFLGHTKKSFHKKCSSGSYSRLVWHMTRIKYGNQHSQHPKKHKKQPETQKQVSWPDSGSQNREIEFISKNYEEREDVQIKKLIHAPCEET